MKAYEIIQQITPRLATEIVSYFYYSEREVYKTTVSTLSTQRKLRPVFVTKKSRDKQFEWIVGALGTKRSDEIAQHLLQAWLMKARSDLLVSFLDELDVEHDGSGAVEELPKELDAAKVSAAIDKLLSEYSSEEVTIYLHLFQRQESEGWPEISEALEKDARLKLGETAEAPEAGQPEEQEEPKEADEPVSGGGEKEAGSLEEDATPDS